MTSVDFLSGRTMLTILSMPICFRLAATSVERSLLLTFERSTSMRILPSNIAMDMGNRIVSARDVSSIRTSASEVKAVFEPKSLSMAALRPGSGVIVANWPRADGESTHRKTIKPLAKLGNFISGLQAVPQQRGRYRQRLAGGRGRGRR